MNVDVQFRERVDVRPIEHAPKIPECVHLASVSDFVHVSLSFFFFFVLWFFVQPAIERAHRFVFPSRFSYRFRTKKRTKRYGGR